MDLLATVRKEGSRGGRGDFKWTDVQNSSHRENYLGHSVMAPVGRWQKGKDLNWYAKADADDTDAAEKAALERKEELRRVKEAEQDAMARALGLPVPDRTNANLQEVSNKRDFDKTLKDALQDTDETGGRGVGFDGARYDKSGSQVLGERIEGNAEFQDKELQYALREYERRHGGSGRRRRSRSGERDRQCNRIDGSRNSKGEHRQERQSRSERERHRRRISRSRSRSRDRHQREQQRERSRSPRRRDDDYSQRRRRQK